MHVATTNSSQCIQLLCCKFWTKPKGGRKNKIYNTKFSILLLPARGKFKIYNTTICNISIISWKIAFHLREMESHHIYDLHPGPVFALTEILTAWNLPFLNVTLLTLSNSKHGIVFHGVLTVPSTSTLQLLKIYKTHALLVVFFLF